MIRHDFTSHKLKQLLDLKTCQQQGLKNPVCEPAREPKLHTISCIDSELASRGYFPIRKQNTSK